MPKARQRQYGCDCQAAAGYERYRTHDIAIVACRQAYARREPWVGGTRGSVFLGMVGIN